VAEHLASLGYIVVAANFPLTNYFTPGKPTLADVVNQPADVSFLLDTLLKWNETPESPFFKKVDPSRVAAVGLSLGGLTTTLVSFHPKLRDPRIKVAVSIAGPTYMFNETFFGFASLPFMMVAGGADAIVSYASNAGNLPRRAPGTTLVTLQDASHTAFASVARWMFRFSHNADSFGCRALMKNIPESVDFDTSLGGPDMGVVSIDVVKPCAEPELPRSMRPQRQHSLTTLAISTFLESYFNPDEGHRERDRRFLYTTLPRENKDIRVESPAAP
jgi:predicted dienelactone hydrolase